MREQENERERERERALKGSYSIFYNLILEMLYHHFCHILLVTQTTTGTVWEGTTQGCEYQEVGIICGHLGGWLPWSPRE